MDIEKALGLTGIEYIKRCRQARMDGTVVKIAGIGFLPEEAEMMYQKNLYIVTYRKIFAVCYSQAQRQYYSHCVYTEPNKGIGLTGRGRYYIYTAKEVNRLLGCELLNTDNG